MPEEEITEGTIKPEPYTVTCPACCARMEFPFHPLRTLKKPCAKCRTVIEIQGSGVIAQGAKDHRYRVTCDKCKADVVFSRQPVNSCQVNCSRCDNIVGIKGSRGWGNGNPR